VFEDTVQLISTQRKEEYNMWILHDIGSKGKMKQEYKGTRLVFSLQ
jgi:hypothetical protein